MDGDGSESKNLLGLLTSYGRAQVVQEEQWRLTFFQFIMVDEAVASFQLMHKMCSSIPSRMIRL